MWTCVEKNKKKTPKLTSRVDLKFIFVENLVDFATNDTRNKLGKKY